MFSEYFIITVDPVSVARQNIQGETLESQIASLTPPFERHIRDRRRCISRDQQLPVAIAVFFLRRRHTRIRRVLSQQLATQAIDLPGGDRRRLTADRATHALPVGIVGVTAGEVT